MPFGENGAVVQHGDAVGELHHHLHVVLDDQDGEVLADAPHQLHGLVGLGRAHAGGRFVEAQKLRLGRERDADLEIALLAVRQIGGQFLGLAEQADGVKRGFRLAVDVGEALVMRRSCSSRAGAIARRCARFRARWRWAGCW